MKEKILYKSLEEKLNNINKPELMPFEEGQKEYEIDGKTGQFKCGTIAEFYSTFVEPRLPKNKEYVIEWHKMLMEYVNKKNNMLGFRTGNTAGKLRRGWLTETDTDFNFFYTDNYFAHYFFKLSNDADVDMSSVGEEFYDLMVNREFPVRFNAQMGTKEYPYEKQHAAMNVYGKSPELGTFGYKLAHIVDAGREYDLGEGKVIGLADVIDKYFDLGKEEDWRWENLPGEPPKWERTIYEDICKNRGYSVGKDKAKWKEVALKNYGKKYYVRKNFHIDENCKDISRKLAVACFLRMVHPMNYFLAPKTPNQGIVYNSYTIKDEKGNLVKRRDIAEEKKLISYVREKIREYYRIDGHDYFQEFLDAAMVPSFSEKEDGTTEINIVYSKNGIDRVVLDDNMKADLFYHYYYLGKSQTQTQRDITGVEYKASSVLVSKFLKERQLPIFKSVNKEYGVKGNKVAFIEWIDSVETLTSIEKELIKERFSILDSKG